jgi:hypothetical protein
MCRMALQSCQQSCWRPGEAGGCPGHLHTRSTAPLTPDGTPAVILVYNTTSSSTPPPQGAQVGDGGGWARAAGAPGAAWRMPGPAACARIHGTRWPTTCSRLQQPSSPGPGPTAALRACLACPWTCSVVRQERRHWRSRTRLPRPSRCEGGCCPTHCKPGAGHTLALMSGRTRDHPLPVHWQLAPHAPGWAVCGQVGGQRASATSPAACAARAQVSVGTDQTNFAPVVNVMNSTGFMACNGEGPCCFARHGPGVPGSSTAQARRRSQHPPVRAALAALGGSSSCTDQGERQRQPGSLAAAGPWAGAAMQAHAGSSTLGAGGTLRAVGQPFPV